MAIRFACRCGMLLVVRDEQVGVVAPCPLCGCAVEARAGGRLAAGDALPAPARPSIAVACSCGAAFRVPGRQAGLVAPCPACAQPLRARVLPGQALLSEPALTFAPSAAAPATSPLAPLAHVAGKVAPCRTCRTPINVRACRCCVCGTALPGRIVAPSADVLGNPPGAGAEAAWLALTCAALGALLVSPALSMSGLLVALGARRAGPDPEAARRLALAVAFGVIGIALATYLLPRVLSI